MNSSARDAVARVNLDSVLGERGTDGVLRRERVRPGGDDLGAGGAQGEHEACGLRLEMHDDGDATTGERAVLQPLLGSRWSTGMCRRAQSMRRRPSGASVGSAIRAREDLGDGG